MGHSSGESNSVLGNCGSEQIFILDKQAAPSETTRVCLSWHQVWVGTGQHVTSRNAVETMQATSLLLRSGSVWSQCLSANEHTVDVCVSQIPAWSPTESFWDLDSGDEWVSKDDVHLYFF